MSTSNICQQVIDIVRCVFPQLRIVEEEFIKYKGQKLYLDIFIPQLDLVIEVHGNQHFEFVEHFHIDEHGFRESRRRDRLKEEWADLNGYTFLVLPESDLPITSERLLELIYDTKNNRQG